MANQTDVSNALQGSGVNVSNLGVKDIGGLTAVFGTVATDADKKKAEQAIEAKLGKISNHLEVQVSTAAPSAALRTYVVKSGDTLSKIAKEFYGDATDWKKIHAANGDLIRDPDKLQPGWSLQIPA
jgi:nucleoid-associated protein YgaU